MRISRKAMSASIATGTRSMLRLPRRLAHASRVGLQIIYWTLTFQLHDGLKRRRDARLIRRSGMFDAQFYLAQCRGDPAARNNPVEHYLDVGADKGLDPSPLFDSSGYAARHPDVAADGENLLAHYIRSRAARQDEAAAPVMAPDEEKGEPLLLGHPFRVSPSPESVLVLASRMPAFSRALVGSGDARVLRLVQLLRGLGHPVTLASADAEALPDDLAELRQEGVAVTSGFDAAVAHLAAEGHRYRAVVLCGPEHAWRFVIPARAFAPQATVIYDRGRHRPDRLDELCAACADVVLVRTPLEREALARPLPGTRVEVVPDAGGALGAGHDGAEDAFGPILKGRLELAIGAAGPAQASHQRPAPALEAAPRVDVPPAKRNGHAKPAGAHRAVLAVGVYLCDAENHAPDISRELSRATEWKVEQRWVAAGRGPIPEPLAGCTAFRQRTRAPKFVLLNRLLHECDLGLYDYVLVCDDDIRLPERFVDRYLDLVTRYDLALAQPARTHESYTDHLIVERLDGLVARRTRFVEIGPLFSMRKDALRLLTPFEECSPMGWGYDFVWPVLLERSGLRMGIVDATPVAHDLRKQIQLYDGDDAALGMRTLLSERPHLSPDDAFSILEGYP